ncbi:SusD/RagB family nutrient-binding outer membrane lipoprotein [Arenibacter sp. F26102]|uniref:SusD/RagB family nutrient-binding outer membrane lipoprotein n=1 Tax=Arenibacter sp. F26102 TaxID=2926416 RepID=UPI001FF216F6|nr:SusD/RagB family nutrient-binding outer membrane lipoprotein [Arenibacter sp. F26102]MCK0147225.1 SusD/RagB family nutrient-binding outer membrane lipoprotein [Arenibacter sp. F26102]
MNNNKNIVSNTLQIAVFLTFVFLQSGCTGDFEELNTPPKSVVSVDPGLLLTDVQKNIVLDELGELPNNIQGSWIQHWAGGQILGQSRYIAQPFDFDSYDKLRSLALIKHELLEGLEEDPKGRTKLAIAKIMEIYTWQGLTDKFGPIPYTESGKPIDELIMQPKYDSQESIYQSLIVELDSAVAQLNATDESFGDADLFYNGDVSLWTKFANSLKLRLGMRIKYADAALSKTTVESALSRLLIDSNSENAKVPTSNDITSNRNPNLRQFSSGSPDLFYLAEKFINVLVETEDPRLPLLAAPNVAGQLPEYQGVKVAETDNYYSGIIRNQFSTPSIYFDDSYEIPVYAFSYAEVCFFKAEAALENWGGFTDLDAEIFYKQGVIAAMSMEPFNISEADIPVSYATAEFSLTGTKEQKLEKIMTQKWIHLFGRNQEAWSEWRRTGYPVLNPGPFAGGAQLIPRRLIYSSEEQFVNKDNYDAAVSTLSDGDSYVSKVWWDKK